MLDTKDVRIGAYNFVVIGLIAVLFIVLLKMITTKFPIPGVTEVVHSV